MCSRGQAIRVRSDRAAAIEHQRIRAGQLDRPADPPAASGRGVERVLSVAIVAQHADRSGESERGFGLSDRLDKKLLELRQPRFAGAGFLRQLEELVAMVEREREHRVVHRARRGDPMQAGQRRILVGSRNAARRWRENSRARSRVGIAGAQPWRETTSAPQALA